MQMMWFLKWVPWALLHGNNPFHTDALFYPDGVSLAWNTAVPTLGVLAAPLTLTAGPALSFVVLITLGPPLMALTSFWWLRRHVARSWPAAFGALLLAFSPYMSGHMLGHLNLVFTGLLPLLLILTEDLLWRRPRTQMRTGLYLGLVTAAQLGISEELLLILLVSVVLVLLGSLCVQPALVWSAIADAWRAAVVAVAVTIGVASPLLISQLVLSRAVVVDTSQFQATLEDFVHGSVRQVFGSSAHSNLGGAEHGVYLGWPVLIVLILGVALTWRDHAVRVVASTGVALVVLCTTPIFSGVPALESVLPSRYSFGLFFVIAWLFARWLDQLTGRLHLASTRPGQWLSAVSIGLAGIALISLVPKPVTSYPLPAQVEYFGSAWQRSHVPTGSAILLLPAGDGRGMFYQQQADFEFNQPGGYAMRPPSTSTSSAAGDLLVRLGNDARNGIAINGSDLQAGRAALCELSLRAIVVVRSVAEGPQLIDLATDLAGRGPDHLDGGASVWLVQCSSLTVNRP
ncbi:hypothetical protein ABIB25_005895 [Nakamurella sp. UYEF19]|uniref:hypothetical protein n=1 Tax=Nakamurella sp. UYEF19 TaxID=1756392 RepID=UPI003394C26E